MTRACLKIDLQCTACAKKEGTKNLRNRDALRNLNVPGAVNSRWPLRQILNHAPGSSCCFEGFHDSYRLSRVCREELFQPDLWERVVSSYRRVSEEQATARATLNTMIPDPAGAFRIMMASPRAGNSCRGYASVGFHLTKFWRLDTHTLRSSEAKTLLSKG